ncbi:MAG: DEAD/DEAH box helicase family protein [Nitrospirae bacterium]|nr:DEAD/DEAH box helicase family protein [Nitrospirota bacterium]
MVQGLGDELEWKTRKKRIDPRLDACDWRLPTKGQVPLRTPYRTEEYPTDNGPADYALHLDGKVLGIVEAKKVTLGPQNVLTQAERYARGATNNGFDFNGLRVPFLYSTNGEVIWFHDIRHPLNRSRRIAGFHTPEALKEQLGRDFDASCRWFTENANAHPRLRPYQVEANTATEQAIANRKREMLVAMATGSGKTFTMANQMYRFMKSGVSKRILFLVDRRALAAQAVRTLASFEPEPGQKFDKLYEVYSQRFHRDDLDEEEKFDPEVLPSDYLLKPSPDHSFVYVCTIQRMAINLFGRNAIFGSGDEEIDEDADHLDIPIHAFDVVIADECHRGYTSQELSVWRNTLDHFDAIKIGLTATPAAHTTSYFKEVVFRYEYERAVREGYLVDYDPVAVHSDVRLRGVFVKEGEKVERVDTETGNEQLDLMEDERHFDVPEVEQHVTSPDSNRKIIEELKKHALEHEQKYGRFPKTLIFAANDLPHTSHANQLVDICRRAFERGDAFVQKITGSKDVDRPLQRIREFRNRPLPGIVVSVDMMSTGVDIPDLEFIVLLRPIKSRILFEQMLGRGTRKGEKHPDKSHFTVFDCFGGSLLEYFRKATAISAIAPERVARTIEEVINDVWSNRDREYNICCLVKRLQRINKEIAPEGRDNLKVFLPDGDLGRYAQGLPHALNQDFVATMKLLRDPDFQKLLTDFPRPKRVFYVAIESQDTVSSEVLIRDAVGNEWTPGDYIKAFHAFVRENPDQIQAIGILLNRPQDWGMEALVDLQSKLAVTKLRFTVKNLQTAYGARYKKALVDIISMIKHAAREGEPLLTAEERVEKVFNIIRSRYEFSYEQQNWLARIREHLVANLSIDPKDFDEIPVLSREGGWQKARGVFEKGRLRQILQDFNQSIAA